MKIIETEAKSIIGTTKVPSADYAINPYVGCQFGCSYCYASFMGRFVGEKTGNWGNYVYVKTNAVELMQHDIVRLLRKNPHPRIVISTVTDPYQGAERKYRLTRGILQVFAEHDYQGRVNVLTKSPMVLEDLEILQQIHHPEVGLSVTTTDDTLSRLLEAHAPAAGVRVRTLRSLNDAGIPTYAFIGPFLPHMMAKPELIDTLLAEIAATGTTQVKVEFLNLPKYVRPRLNAALEDEPAEIRNFYTTSQQQQYRAETEPVIRDLLDKHGLTLRFNEIILHTGNQQLTESPQ